MNQLSKTTRIEQYAKALPAGTECTASEVIQALGQRNITERSVGLVFRSLPDIMEMVPLKHSGRNKWRRLGCDDYGMMTRRCLHTGICTRFAFPPYCQALKDTMQCPKGFR